MLKLFCCIDKVSMNCIFLDNFLKTELHCKLGRKCHLPESPGKQTHVEKYFNEERDFISKFFPGHGSGNS